MLTNVNKGASPALILLALTFQLTSVFADDTATLSGVITASGPNGPVEGATVFIGNIDQPMPPLKETTTNAAGEWSAEVEFNGQPELTVVVEAAGPEHAPNRHGGSVDFDCYFNCGGGDGEFTIQPEETYTGLDISLEPGGRFSGTVTRSSDGQPLENAMVRILSPDALHALRSPHFRGFSDETGAYESTLAIAPGDYHLTAHPGHGDNYVIQAWQDYSCQLEECPILDTDAIEITAGNVTDDLDFALKDGATVSGTLLPDDIDRVVRLYDGSGLMLGSYFFESWQSNEDQWEFTGLAGGSYYVELSPMLSSEPWLRVLHNGLLCPFSGCDRATGSPLVIPSGASLTLPEITLESGGQIDGELIDADTGQAPVIAGENSLGTYDIVSDDGTVVGGGSILVDDGDVLLWPSAALPDGEYYVRTYSTFFGDGIGYRRLTGDSSTGYLPGYVDAMYPDVACAGVKCDLSAAETVSVTDGEITTITIELSTGSSITGSIVDDATDEPIPNAIVRVLSANNETLATVYTDEDGEFLVGGFPDGEYYLRTSMSSSPGLGDTGPQLPYFDHLYGSTSPCSEQLCNAVDGTAINLTGDDAGPFELRVDQGPVISGRITAQPSGLQLSNGQVEVYDSNGAFVGSYRVNPTTGKYQTTALPPGDYTLVPIVSPAYTSVSAGGGSGTVSATSTSTSPGSMDAPLSSDGFVVSIDTEDVSADLPVIDMGIDRIFDSQFEADD
ncbi:carboxypeptidase regulatory-like domain-containing protein [Wenzhouxiangella sp. AB-CW3]|uniref:MSCRAMM family protein n=1 Tax=Wenzhouxiangella sp. AB-CW3 TaxID=2771012 RepID=UPI00168B7BEA|nr:carboxypeptidase-like regulatory domain-containing protein [Wenzhouxiangella sp. AB-CW3]QOC21332.1 carboxypeptidase regulatory-like domain-containing protein [Wenzhouxiangella sp. AB-CW3]